MTGVFGEPSGSHVDVPLLDGEKIIRQQAANLLSHGVNMIPGRLVLTSQRLLFRPLNYGGVSKLIKLGLPLLPGGTGAILGALMDAAVSYQGKLAGTIPIEQIDSVSVGQFKANMIHPASILINLKSGKSIEVAIYTSLATIAPLPRHAEVRDEMLSQISASLPRK